MSEIQFRQSLGLGVHKLRAGYVIEIMRTTEVVFLPKGHF